MYDKKDEEDRKHREAIASYVMLPFVMGVPPIVGWYIGVWVDQYFDISPYGKYGFLALGICSGVREIYRIINKYKDEDV